MILRARQPGNLLLDGILETQQRTCIHKLSTIMLPKQDLHCDNAIAMTVWKWEIKYVSSPR